MGRQGKEQVESAILDAVIGCKYEAVCGDVRITQVAARAGVSTRTLNRYFPDKDELIYLAAIRFLNGRYTAMAQAYDARDLTGKNGLERIRFLLELHADYYRSHPMDATMVDSANLRYTIGSLEENYPKVRVGLDIRRIFLANLELGRRDGSIRGDLNPRSIWVMVAATYHGLLHRLAYLNATKRETVDCETFFPMYGDFISMVEKYLRP